MQCNACFLGIPYLRKLSSSSLISRKARWKQIKNDPSGLHKSQQPWFREYCLKMSNFKIENVSIEIGRKLKLRIFPNNLWWDTYHLHKQCTAGFIEHFILWHDDSEVKQSSNSPYVSLCLSLLLSKFWAFANPSYSSACLKGFLLVHWGFKVFLLL